MNHPSCPHLDLRSRQVLRTLISRHIETGDAVGSQTLAKQAQLEVSSATIRNILADLEELGLLSAPHTSSGRVPTPKGYRFYVDALLQVSPVSAAERLEVARTLGESGTTSQRLGCASDLLSSLSQFAGVVSLPKRDRMAFKHVEFVGLEPTRVLAVVVFADNSVQNRVIDLPVPIQPDELVEISNFLNQELAGRSLAELRRRMLRELRQAQDELQNLMTDSIRLAESALDPIAEDMLVSGQNRLLGTPGLTDMTRLRELFDAFNSKREILQLLERTEQAEGVQIFIGEECGAQPLNNVSVISAPYCDADGQVLGVLGVIGPQRMDYSRIVPVVQTTAAVLGESLAGHATSRP